MSASQPWSPDKGERAKSKNSPSREMYYKVPHENWFQKGLRVADQGLKIYGTAQGLYQAGSAIATGLRAAAPMMALL